MIDPNLCRRGLDEAQYKRALEYILHSVQLPAGWGTPELRMFLDAGRSDGVDACRGIRAIFASRISPTCPTDPMSLSMGILVPLMLGIDHVHMALADARVEGIIMTSIMRAVLDHYKATCQI